jgi:hypothetical protein
VRLPVWMRHRAADFGRRLVLAQALVNDLPQQVVDRPGKIFDFGDQRGPLPMHAAEHQRPSEAAGARRRHLERHLDRGERLQRPSRVRPGIWGSRRSLFSPTSA